MRVLLVTLLAVAAATGFVSTSQAARVWISVELTLLRGGKTLASKRVRRPASGSVESTLARRRA